MDTSKKNINQNAMNRENAIIFFRFLFEKNLNLKTEYNLEEQLEEMYISYCKEYFTSQKNYSDIERLNIQNAYLYIKRILKERNKFELNSTLTEELLNSYNNLMKGISEYRFYYHWKNSYGYLQNKTTEKILIDNSLMQQFLEGVLKRIDNYLKSISDPAEIDGFYCEMVKKLEDLKKGLDYQGSSLIDAKWEYYEAWENAKRGSGKYTTDSELGRVKNLWRLERNNACHNILQFYKELKMIYDDLNYEENNNNIDTENDIIGTYNYGIRRIVTGPYYFCYLNEDEKKEIENKKILKIEQSRKNSKKES